MHEHQFENYCEEWVGNGPEHWKFDDNGVEAHWDWVRVCRPCGLVTMEYSHADGTRFLKTHQMTAEMLALMSR